MSNFDFDEKWYLEINPDVATAVATGSLKSGLDHYELFGKKEGRASNPFVNMSREDKALFALNKTGLGLEIGPSFNPVASKENGYNVHIIDHLSTEDLRRKYSTHNVNIDKIEEVDFVWSGQSLTELIGKTSCYDWIIASHVIEHIPDLITFVKECDLLLKPEGRLSLIIPDKRYCFDYFCPLSTSGGLLDAYRERRKCPSAGQVFDHYANSSKRGGKIAWDDSTASELELLHSFDLASSFWKKASTDNEYIDVHCWRFTPELFRLVIYDLNMLGLISNHIIKEFQTSGCEFYVTLAKGSDKLSEADRFTLLLETVAS